MDRELDQIRRLEARAEFAEHVAEHVAHRRAQPLRPIEHDQQARRRVESRSISWRRNVAQTRLFSVAVCTSPNTRFSPVMVTPSAITT